jgi:hypothetical protein
MPALLRNNLQFIDLQFSAEAQAPKSEISEPAEQTQSLLSRRPPAHR